MSIDTWERRCNTPTRHVRAFVPDRVRRRVDDYRRWRFISENGTGPRHSSALRLVERITRVDADVLQYVVTIDDPKTYTRPWTMALLLTSPRGYDLLPYECHEGNHGLPNILSAERAEDRAIDADAGRGILRARRPLLNNPTGPAAEGAER